MTQIPGDPPSSEEQQPSQTIHPAESQPLENHWPPISATDSAPAYHTPQFPDAPTPTSYPEDPPLFHQFTSYVPPKERIPHAGHLAILCLLSLCSLIVAILIARAGVHYHLFHVKTVAQASTEIHYTLGTEGIFYILTLALCILVFPLVWNKPFFVGLQWRGQVALQRLGPLSGAAVVCFILAVIDGVLIPGPKDAPIDEIFRMPGAAWLLFGFGVTFAPFFEELAFRGFLLPALCTGIDWLGEKAGHHPPPPLDENDHPHWSMRAMAISAFLTSIVFALMHAEQTGTTLHSLGPFLLLVCVSLVLCAARLWLRSLAASVVIHACYNFLLFSLMFLGTSGFKHLDKM